MNFASWFESGLDYNSFLKKYANEEQLRRWNALHSQIQLKTAQRDLLRSFRREMKVLVVAGAWCGDCVNQCPIFPKFSDANEFIRVRFHDRDDSAELSRELSLCGAPRVPSVLFLSEDNFPCGRYGDRTLAKYRQMAADSPGSVCPTGLGTHDGGLLEAVIQDWLNEFERIQLMLLTSSRLRKLHGD
jgi:thiol-disulfide isomerase/thioredoxin